MGNRNAITKEDLVLIEPWEDFTFPCRLDQGVQFGLGFFETILIREQAYFLEEHIERLNRSLAQFGYDRSLPAEILASFLEERSFKNVALKLMVSEKNAFVLVRPIPYQANDYVEGKNVTFSRCIRSKCAQLVAHKSLNYGENLLQSRWAMGEGYDDCLFLNENGHVTESTLANLFVIEEGKLVTPPVSDGLLPGIIRRKILENFDVREAHLQKKELMACAGAFLTNSLFGVMPISRICDVNLSRHPLVAEVSRFFGAMLPK